MERKNIMKKEELERICFNCNYFFPASIEKPTELGICLRDEVFEPFLDELLENENYAPCQDLVNQKKFSGEKDECEYFEEIEVVERFEIDDDSELASEIRRLSEEGELNLETFETALIEEQFRRIDWKTFPVDKYVTRLKGTDEAKQLEAMASLGSLIALENKEAFKELFNFFKELPPPKTLEEVHFKMEVLRQLEHTKSRTVLIPQLIHELYHTTSNNTTRQYFDYIFRFLKFFPYEDIHEPMEQMLNDKRFSHRIKRKIEYVLYY